MTTNRTVMPQMSVHEVLAMDARTPTEREEYVLDIIRDCTSIPTSDMSILKQLDLIENVVRSLNKLRKAEVAFENSMSEAKQDMYAVKSRF